MFFNLFSKYLIKEGKITEEQLEIVRNAQSSTRVKLGLIAVSEKMITEKQAEEINRKQAVMDKRFGDIAVELGYLVPDQVSRLLELQGKPYMLLSQTFTDKRILTLGEIEAAFNSYVSSLGYNDNEIEALKNDDIDGIIAMFVKNVPENVLEIISVAIRTLNRLISTDLSIAEGYKTDKYDYNHAAGQAIEGDYNIKTSISGSDEGILEVAETFAGEEFGQVDMDALDSIAEFINIVNGLFATSLSYRRVQVDLAAPLFDESAGSISEGEIYVVPLEVNQKPFDLVINVK